MVGGGEGVGVYATEPATGGEVLGEGGEVCHQKSMATIWEATGDGSRVHDLCQG